MTQSELNAYEARRNTKALPHAADAADRESDLHEQIFAECRRRGWIALHGAMSERTHRTAGEPDFIILGEIAYPGFKYKIPFVRFVECKTRKGKLSAAQTALHFHAEKLGHSIHVVRSFEEFLKII